jgi:hypothetical protein
MTSRPEQNRTHQSPDIGLSRLGLFSDQDANRGSLQPRDSKMNRLTFHFFPGRHVPTFAPFFEPAPCYSDIQEPQEERSESSDDQKTGDQLMTISGPSAQYVISLPPVSDDRCA